MLQCTPTQPNNKGKNKTKKAVIIMIMQTYNPSTEEAEAGELHHNLEIHFF
jgi:hypothetical protein